MTKAKINPPRSPSQAAFKPEGWILLLFWLLAQWETLYAINLKGLLRSDLYGKKKKKKACVKIALVAQIKSLLAGKTH